MSQFTLRTRTILVLGFVQVCILTLVLLLFSHMKQELPEAVTKSEDSQDIQRGELPAPPISESVHEAVLDKPQTAQPIAPEPERATYPTGVEPW